LPCTSTMYKLAAEKMRLPLIVSVPTELPGDSAPPARMVVGPTVPLPPSVPPKLTNTGEDAIEPFTLKVPAFDESRTAVRVHRGEDGLAGTELHDPTGT
jgi:hypothetical protein